MHDCTDADVALLPLPVHKPVDDASDDDAASAASLPPSLPAEVTEAPAAAALPAPVMPPSTATAAIGERPGSALRTSRAAAPAPEWSIEEAFESFRHNFNLGV